MINKSRKINIDEPGYDDFYGKLIRLFYSTSTDYHVVTKFYLTDKDIIINACIKTDNSETRYYPNYFSKLRYDLLGVAYNRDTIEAYNILIAEGKQFNDY